MDWLVEKLQTMALWIAGLALLGVGVWVYPTLKQQFASPPQTTAPPVASLNIAQTAQLIKAAEPTVRDPTGWANDLLSVLKIHNLPQSHENICAVIAVVDQESGFITNPAVPNLGKIAEKAVTAKLHKFSILGTQAEHFLNQFPNKQNSFMQRIRTAKTERDLDLAYRDLMGGIENYAKQYKLGVLMNNGFARNFIESMNEIDTIGSMQVAVAFATQFEMEQRNGKALTLQEIYQVRDRLYTRQGGLYYGTLLLLGYESGYNKKLYRFADFNAGRYASRNAAFQSMLAELLKETLTKDGDLLIYNTSGTPTLAVSQSEHAVRKLVQRFQLALSTSQIRRDLLKEKHFQFKDTHTYQYVLNLYQTHLKKTPVYAVVPSITLNSEKTSRILTTEKFANSVYTRYQRCIAH